MSTPEESSEFLSVPTNAEIFHEIFWVIGFMKYFTRLKKKIRAEMVLYIRNVASWTAGRTDERATGRTDGRTHIFGRADICADGRETYF